MATFNKPPLTPPEYERIFKVVHGLLLNEDCDPSKACTYFAIIGAFIMQKHHHRNANPRAGAAAYNLGLKSNNIIAFGRVENGLLKSDEDAFHFWIECEGWIIDFAAPLFQEIGCSPKMFQKPKSAATPSPDMLQSKYSYAHSVNPILTTELLQHFNSFPVNTDLAQIAGNWYQMPPKKILPSIPISDASGRTQDVKLSSVNLAGAW